MHAGDLAAYAPLPFALAHLGWGAGVFFLTLAGIVTWYTSLLLASLDRHDGHRHTRYCDLARSIYGVALPPLVPLCCLRSGQSIAAMVVAKWCIRWCEHGFRLAGRSGYWAVIFFQQLASIGNNLAIQIVAGQSMKVWPGTSWHSGDVGCLSDHKRLPGSVFDFCHCTAGSLQAVPPRVPNTGVLRHQPAGMDSGACLSIPCS